jgi:hypothetical protein
MNKMKLESILIDNDLCISKNPCGTDKHVKSFLSKFYEKNFSSFQNQPIDLMEIGFRHGASLALWDKYFEKAKILGVDNFSDLAVGSDMPIVKEWVESKKITIKTGDAYSAKFAGEIENKFDIIIDDGPHWIYTQQRALELYLPKLKLNGIFIIEDILIGGLAIFPLLRQVPLGFSVSFFDYRWDKPIGDNCLFVVRHTSKTLSVINRIYIIFIAILYFFSEGPFRLFKHTISL